MEPIKIERSFTTDEVCQLTGWNLAELIRRVNACAEGFDPALEPKPRVRRSVVSQAIRNTDKEDVPVPRRRGRPRKQQPVPMLRSHDDTPDADHAQEEMSHDDTPDADHAQEEMSSSF